MESKQKPERTTHPRAWTIAYVILIPAVLAAIVGTAISFRKRFADAFHKLQAGNAPVVIAILDTGVSPELFPELKGKVLPGRNFFDDNDNTADESKHGSTVAQQAILNCPLCRILPVKLTRHGAGIRPDDVARGIEFALSKGASVINCSFGVDSSSPGLEKAMGEATTHRVPVLAAAGAGVSNPFRSAKLHDVFPQAFPDTIVVTAVNPGGQPDGAANEGPEIDLAVMQLNASTSFATGRVSGLVGEFIRQHPDEEPRRIRELLRASTTGMRNGDPDRLGFGILDDSGVFLKREFPPITTHVYRTTGAAMGEIDFNSEEDIASLEGQIECKDGKKLAVEKQDNPLKKGRARLVFTAPSTGTSCSFEARLTVAGGGVRMMEVPL